MHEFHIFYSHTSPIYLFLSLSWDQYVLVRKCYSFILETTCRCTDLTNLFFPHLILFLLCVLSMRNGVNNRILFPLHIPQRWVVDGLFLSVRFVGIFIQLFEESQPFGDDGPTAVRPSGHIYSCPLCCLPYSLFSPSSSVFILSHSCCFYTGMFGKRLLHESYI